MCFFDFCNLHNLVCACAKKATFHCECMVVNRIFNTTNGVATHQKHRHFSYPAAYNQSTVQRKSCGSVMLGLGFSKQHISFDYHKLPSVLIGEEGDEKIVEELKFSSINYNYYYASVGYAYNWVFARNWLRINDFCDKHIND